MKTKTILAAMLLLAMSGLARAEVVEKEFDVSPGQTLEIDLDTGVSVTVRGEAGSKVVVRARRTGRDVSDIDLRVERMNNGVTIVSEYKSAWRNHSGGVDIEVTVPSRFDLDVETQLGATYRPRWIQ